MLEVMAAGCLLIASKTPPVLEVIHDGVNGLLVDFFSPQDIANRVEEALNHPQEMKKIRANARETILKRYDLAKLLPQHLQWMFAGKNSESLKKRSVSKGFGRN
jgi:glycosyltransferase involved in cell wall biosynthesis